MGRVRQKKKRGLRTNQGKEGEMISEKQFRNTEEKQCNGKLRMNAEELGVC